MGAAASVKMRELEETRDAPKQNCLKVPPQRSYRVLSLEDEVLQKAVAEAHVNATENSENSPCDPTTRDLPRERSFRVVSFDMEGLGTVHIQSSDSDPDGLVMSTPSPSPK